VTAAQTGQVTGRCAAPPPVSRLRPARGYASGKEDYLRRLRKIEGQVRSLQKMIENDTECPDVVTQVASATRALQEVAVGLLNDHISHCVIPDASSPDEQGEARLSELAAMIRQVVQL
jgi:DNA-binding FrmR family transcriptional regulator